MTTEPITMRELAEIDVGRLKGVGEVRRKALAAVGIDTVLDLLTYYPRRWIDRSKEARVADLQPGEDALVLVTVRRVVKRVTRNRRTMVTATVGDGSGRMSVVFFNQPWRERQLKEGLEVALWGRADVFQGGLQMTNPVVDMIGDRTGFIVPIYPQSEKEHLNTWEIAGWVENALDRCRPRGLADPVPRPVLERFGLQGRSDALFGIHLPESMQQKEMARRRLAFDELLRVQLVLVRRKRQLELLQAGIQHDMSGDLVRRFHAALPFELTGDQAAAIAEIDADLAGPHPMHRLLQGDVGSGKTVVAVTMLLHAVQGGHQGALMAPTEVLAEQHASGIRNLLGDVSVPAPPDQLLPDRPLRVELLTNRVTGADRKKLLAGLADGSVDIVIGTHALIQQGVAFHDLGAVVVDEQHRFGVEQRAMLREKNASGTVPDVLVMTATPIPRTAAMTVYGDLDVSVIKAKPAARQRIVTRHASGDAEEEDAWVDVRAQVADGHQAYVVCPLIEESEKLEVASAEETFGRLQAVDLRGLRLGLLHGRLPAPEKEAVMARFRAGDLDVLVATTVIEVGVDVPNATVMVILDADRFGIAQLHQLRGRVGRGADQSTCWLVTSESEDGAPNPRVEALVQSDDGFELAEVDLDLRGEGTLMGGVQKGRNDLKLASLRRDRNLVQHARDAAFAIVGTDPAMPDYPDLVDELDLLMPTEGEEFLFKS